MPLLDIATAQPCFHNNAHTSRSYTIQRINLLYSNEKRLLYPWKSFSIPKKANNLNSGRIELWRGRLIIKAVATLEPTSLNPCGEGFHVKVDSESAGSALCVDGNQSSSEDSAKVDEREMLRRMRISKANKGNTPWNKGRKHSPETLKLIKERTRLAMQDPKVKMKLMNLGHAQSKETRIKIGAGVRSGWEKRREKLMLQESCYYEWQNLIAEAAKTGLAGEEELQWDSFKIINEQLKQEWIQSVEERKRTPKSKSSKRAPKSLEQRRKISEAIAAKWADPAYRDRVYSGLARYHGIQEGTERKLRRKPSGDGQTRRRRSSKEKVDSDDLSKPEPKSRIQRIKLKRSGVPLYKDPLVGPKLEMLKNIRAERAAAEDKKSEAITRAKLLIAEAEQAAEALEIAAKRSPIAHASLIETRKLIAEAVQCIMSVEEEHESENDGSTLHTEGQAVAEVEEANQEIEKDVNGAQSSESSDMNIIDFNFKESDMLDLLDEEKNAPASTLNGYNLVNGKENHDVTLRGYNVPSLVLDDTIKLSSFTEQLGEIEVNGRIGDVNQSPVNGSKTATIKEEEAHPKSETKTKKWVRGRLVEVTE